jgi:hypothetical protein
VKKVSPRVKNSRWRIFSPKSQKQKTLGEGIFHREFFSCSRRRNFKKSLFTFNFFLSSTCTYTKDMFKFDIILSMFALFKNFISF